MVERRSNDLVSRDTTGNAMEQCQPNINKQVPIWAVELYNRLTTHLNAQEALFSECISKSVNFQQEMPQLVDA
jgi:hypothetical protein